MADWRFLDRAIILAVHEEQLAQHGGGIGLRDEGLPESALARAENLAAYNPDADAAALAAAYAFGIAKNHPFIDGNKRIGFAVTDTFLRLNGHMITAKPDKVWRFVDGLFAKGKFEFAELDKWLRKNTEELK